MPLQAEMVELWDSSQILAMQGPHLDDFKDLVWQHQTVRNQTAHIYKSLSV